MKKKRPAAEQPTEPMGRRSVIKAGAKVIPALAMMGLALTANPQQVQAGCVGGTCKAVCSETCNNNCTGDCMGSCRGGCGGCDGTCTSSSGR